MSDAMFALVVAEAKPAAEKHTDVEQQLRAAMEAASNHWMVLDQEMQFKGAVGAVMDLHGPDSEVYQILAQEIANMRALGAAASGIPIDFSQLDIPEKTYGILNLWHDVTRKEKR